MKEGISAAVYVSFHTFLHTKSMHTPTDSEGARRLLATNHIMHHLHLSFFGRHLQLTSNKPNALACLSLPYGHQTNPTLSILLWTFPVTSIEELSRVLLPKSSITIRSHRDCCIIIPIVPAQFGLQFSIVNVKLMQRGGSASLKTNGN